MKGDEQKQYDTEIVKRNGFRIENIHPKMEAQESVKIKSEIEEDLYKILIKYNFIL